MAEGFSDFHFLRPLWLLGLPAALLLYLGVRLHLGPDRRWRGVIAPHLLKHLKVAGGDAAWFRPIHLVTLAIALGSLSLAGPAWERERTPFSEDLAPLVIAIDLSQGMDAIDVPPTRLERAKQKARDLLTLRRGARTGLLVYAGTAHMVLPFTDDPSALETFVTALETGIMPVPGKDPGAALTLAEEMLERDTVPGTILFLTDGIGREHAEAFASHGRRTRDQVMVLAFGTSEGGPIRVGENAFLTEPGGRRLTARLDREGLETLASSAGVDVVSATVDDTDVSRVQSRVQSHLRSVREADEATRWKDFGYFFVIPVALLSLLWFRRGWTVQWVPVVAFLTLTGCSPGHGDFRFADLWLTPDQQGRYQFDRGEFVTAAERFRDPTWKAVSFYRAGDLDSAIDWFARLETPESYFNLGNAYARLGSYEQAVASYDEALVLRPHWVEARENRALVSSLIPDPEEQPPGDTPPSGDPTFEADQVEFDEKGAQGERGEVPMEGLTDEQIAEMWLRRLQTSPSDFLRAKFRYQAQPGQGGPG